MKSQIFIFRYRVIRKCLNNNCIIINYYIVYAYYTYSRINLMIIKYGDSEKMIKMRMKKFHRSFCVTHPLPLYFSIIFFIYTYTYIYQFVCIKIAHVWKYSWNNFYFSPKKNIDKTHKLTFFGLYTDFNATILWLSYIFYW